MPSTMTRLFFTTQAPLHLRVVASVDFQTEEVAAPVVFCRESFPGFWEAGLSHRVGYQIGREERRRIMPRLMVGTLKS
jgi:hypothetical protein